jgi:hypothetical protein
MMRVVSSDVIEHSSQTRVIFWFTTQGTSRDRVYDVLTTVAMAVLYVT